VQPTYYADAIEIHLLVASLPINLTRLGWFRSPFFVKRSPPSVRLYENLDNSSKMEKFEAISIFIFSKFNKIKIQISIYNRH
jgi:hypothetical protein